MGGKARWQGIDPARRSRIMKRVRKGKKTRQAGPAKKKDDSDRISLGENKG